MHTNLPGRATHAPRRGAPLDQRQRRRIERGDLRQPGRGQPLAGQIAQCLGQRPNTAIRIHQAGALTTGFAIAQQFHPWASLR